MLGCDWVVAWSGVCRRDWACDWFGVLCPDRAGELSIDWDWAGKRSPVPCPVPCSEWDCAFWFEQVGTSFADWVRTGCAIGTGWVEAHCADWMQASCPDWVWACCPVGEGTRLHGASPGWIRTFFPLKTRFPYWEEKGCPEDVFSWLLNLLILAWNTKDKRN